MTTLVLMRGVSGSGKSTYVVAHYPGAEIYDTDSHLTVDGVYTFDLARIPAIHDRLLVDVRGALRRKAPLIVVDKCNLSLTAYGPYLRLARLYGYSVTVVTLSVDPLAAYQRGVHGAPARVIATAAESLRRGDRGLPSWVTQVRP
jgi:predicted kinase